jgi:hypothetical protein
MLAIVLFVFIRFTDSNYHFGIFRLFRFLVYMLFVLLCFFFWPLCCLFFLDLRILITPLGWVSEWVIVVSAIFQLYHGESKLIFNEMMMRSALF